jgi:hypothetical protein
MSLDDMIASMRRLGTLPELAAAKAAPLVSAVSKVSAAAGRTPNGDPWPPRKDGHPALQNAAAAVSAVAVGSVVQIRLDGTSTGDQQVQAIQNARRQIIPASGEGIPAPIASAIAAGVDAAFREIV